MSPSTKSRNRILNWNIDFYKKPFLFPCFFCLFGRIFTRRPLFKTKQSHVLPIFQHRLRVRGGGRQEAQEEEGQGQAQRSEVTEEAQGQEKELFQEAEGQSLAPIFPRGRKRGRGAERGSVLGASDGHARN